MPPLANRCIDSWKVYCPDYEIKQWDESNFDLNYNTYVKEASEAGKWAFVSDVSRLWALVNYGGIYMDTDCELIKPIDEFLQWEAVSGFETEKEIPTALMGAQKGAPLFIELLEDYGSRNFVLQSGEFDFTTNVTIITNKLLEHGLVLNNQLQTVSGFTLYPSEYFCPKNYKTGKLEATSNTHAIHHFNASWQSKDVRRRDNARRKIRAKFDGKFGKIVLKFYNGWDICRTAGIVGLFKKIIKSKA